MDFYNYQCAIPLFALIVLLYLLPTSKSRGKLLPPGPFKLPILGNLLGLSPHTTKPHKYFTELAKTHGPLMTLQLGSVTAIVVSNSHFAKQVLLRNHRVASTLYDLDAVQAHEHGIYSIGSLSATSPKWKILRKIYTTQLLSDKMLVAMQCHRHNVVEKMVCHIRECSLAKTVVDLGQLVYEASFNVMCSTIFSLDLESDGKIREIMDLMNCIIKEIGRPNIVDCYPFLKVVDPQRIRHRITCYCAKLFKIFDDILELRLKSKKDKVNCSAESHNDLMDVILEVMEEQRDQIKREHIHHLLLVSLRYISFKHNTFILNTSNIMAQLIEEALKGT